MPYTPNDPLYASQTHFDNLGLIGTRRAIEYVWDEYRGAGIYVLVADSGVDYAHADLHDQYDHTRDMVGQTGNHAGNPHGTNVAGLIGAEDNDIGGIGLAFDAELVSAFVDLGFFQDGAPLVGLDRYDVVNMSFGGGAYDVIFDQNKDYFGQVVQGRGGLGTIAVKASGNDAVIAAADESENYRMSVGVSATDTAAATRGNLSSYSNYGPSILVAAPGTEVTTTDISGTGGGNTAAGAAGDYTQVSGTSFAAPITSGVVALMLDANPNLGWRDVQDILAQSAHHTGGEINGDPFSTDWTFNAASTWNGGGYHVSNHYGYGEVDVYNAVRIAESYAYIGRPAQTSGNESSSTTTTKITTPTFGTQTIDLAISSKLDIDHVMIRVTLSTRHFEYAYLQLVSPEGRTVTLHDGYAGEDEDDAARYASAANGGITWEYLAQTYRGEDPVGTWHLQAFDSNFGTNLQVRNVTLTIYGEQPIGQDDVYVYTDEFAAMKTLAGQSGRAILNDSAGDNWFDGAALTLGVVLNMNPGSNSFVGGTGLATSASNRLVGAITGDGQDTILGNTLDNRIFGMRGSDDLSGNAGNDWINGGRDADTLSGGEGFDTVDYAGSNAAVRINLSGKTNTEIAQGGHAQGDVLSILSGFNSFEGISGSQYGDRLTGDDRANTLWGKDGDDRLSGLSGSDKLYGGKGNDTLVGGRSGDMLVGGDGDDNLFGDQGYIKLQNGYLFTTGSADHGSASTAFDLDGFLAIAPDSDVNSAATMPHVSVRAIGSNQFDYFSFTNGPGTSFVIDIDGTDIGADLMIRLYAPNGTYTVADDSPGDPGSSGIRDPFLQATTQPGASGTYTVQVGRYVSGEFQPLAVGQVYTLHVSQSQATATFTGFADTLVGGRGADIIDGGGGNDIIYGDLPTVSPAAGILTKTAGLGNDSIETALFVDGLYSLASSPNIANSTTLRHVTVQGAGDGNVDWYAFTVTTPSLTALNVFDIDNATFDSSLTLYNADGTVLAQNDDAPIDPGSSSDTSARIEYKFAAAGTYYLSVSQFAFSDRFGAIVAGGGYDLHLSVANPLLLSLDGDDVITGASGSDTMDGGGGNDVVLISSPADHPASEIINGGGGTDRIRFTSITGGETLALSSLVTNIEIAEITSPDGSGSATTAINLDASSLTQGIELRGNAGANIITGTNFADVIKGGGGNDIVLIRSADSFVGDSIDGGSGMDTIRFTSTSGGETLVLTSSVIGVEIVEFAAGSGDRSGTSELNVDASAIAIGLTIRGNDGGNIIQGTLQADVIEGGGGDDIVLIASPFALLGDSIDGGTETDTIRFTSTSGGDTLVLTSAVIGTDVVEITDASGDGSSQVALNLDVSAVGNGMVLRGNDGVNTITGTGSSDSITGGGGPDTLNGGGGDDIFLVASSLAFQGDSIDGGTETDTIRFTSTSGGDTLVLTSAVIGTDVVEITDASGDNSGQVALNLDVSAVGNGMVLRGNDGVNTITGTGSSDTITGGGGPDTLKGGGGDDMFLIASQAEHPATETIDGGSGTDRIRFTSTLPGQALVLSSHVSNVEIAEITDAAGNATGTTALNLSAALVQQGMQLRGNAGDNTLVGSAFVDVMAGGAGNDKYYVANTNDTVTEAVGKGSDTIYASTSYTLGAGQEIELLQANAGSNALTLTGNSFANAFVSGAGTDTMAGLGGNDTYYVNNGGDFVNEAVGGGIDTVKAGASYTLGAGQEIENVIANAGSTGLTLTGNAFGNSFTSGAGNDTLAGLGGNDVYYVNNTGDIVNEAVGGGSDAISTSVNYTLKAGQEIETLAANAGNTALTLTGNALANTLVSGKGVDTLVGLGGDDRYFVNFALDKVTEVVGGGNDTVYSTVTYTLAAGQEIEVLSANAGSTGITLTGNAFANSLVSGAGNDTLAGLGGNDTYFVNNAGDIVQEAIGGGSDTVRASVEYTLGANQEIEILRSSTGAVGLKLTGNNLNNVLIGDGGGNTLTGGLGVDSFTGAAGNDIFVFNTVADSGVSTPDTILDFTAGDKIDLHLIDADGNGGTGDTAFILDALGDNTFATGHIKQTVSGTTLFLSFNTDSDAASEMTIALLNHGAAMSVGDLVA